MAFMARRPPSLIALGDTELQTLLQPNFLQPLVLKFNSLRLNDLDGPSHSDADGHDDAGDGTSINSHDETFTTLSSSAEVSSGAKIASAQEFGGSLLTLAHSIPSFLASGMTELANQASDRSNPSSSSNTTTNQNLSSLSSQNQHFSSLNNASRGVAFVAAPRDCPPISLSQRCKATTRQKENYRHAHRHTMQDLPDVASCFSNVQKPRLSLGAIPDMTIDSVPLRDLALASTKSYEAVLAATMVSPSVVADPIQEYGTIQPDSIFDEPNTDRDGK